MDIVQNHLEQTIVTKFLPSGKKYEIDMSICGQTFSYIICYSRRNENNRLWDVTISLTDIKEIRVGKSCKEFQTCPDSKNYEPAHCFVIFYGNEFRLQSLAVAAQNEADFTKWIDGLKLFKPFAFSYANRIKVWMTKMYEWMKENNTNYDVTPKDLKMHYAAKLGRRLHNHEIRKFIDKISAHEQQQLGQQDDVFNFQYYENSNASISLEAFSMITKSCLHNQQIFTDCFGPRKLYKADFLEFLHDLQNEELKEIPSSVLKDYFTNDALGYQFMEADKAIDYLFSPDNQLWDKVYDTVTQDMNHPLSHYWIASSHNTYLTGDQVSSQSSVEAYVRCLRQGCRCIEIDCFNGSKATPIEIYHGRTLTTKISFVDVLEAIRDHAFVTSEYPVIISIENHCGLNQQKFMAEKFREIFGAMLVTEPLFENESRLPSPEQLKRRIILKGRKLSTASSNNTSAASASPNCENEAEMMNLLKSGEMFIQNSNNEWEPYFFGLTEKKLFYAEMEAQKEQNDELGGAAGVEQRVEREKSGVRETVNGMQELHFRKRWFHGDINTKEEAEARVGAFASNGAFLVRRSTREGQYCICFYSDGVCYHMKIESKPNPRTGEPLYYLIPNGPEFESLYEVISYYRKHPLDTAQFTLTGFTIPVPQPTYHESQPWFYKELKRDGADKILNNLPVNGSFLVRYSSDGGFVISFRIENAIKHCRVNQDGRLLAVSTEQFETITDLVNYYREHAFYKKLKLEYPVTPELARLSEAQDGKLSRIYSYPELPVPAQTTTSKITVRALKAYNTTDPAQELSFKPDDIITNVEKHNAGWWKGDFGDQLQKWFPYDYVEEIELSESPFGTMQKGAIDLVEAAVKRSSSKEYPYVLAIGQHKLGLRSLEKAKEWQEAINELCNQITSKVKAQESQKKKQKIAKELSELIIYAASVKSLPPLEIIKQKGRVFNELASFSETFGERCMTGYPSSFVWLHQVKLCRIYPKGQRLDSSNYNPMSFWNYGCQMVALNYQTPEKYVQLNHGKFRPNGRCGYVLKPQFMLSTEMDFDPNDKKCLSIFGIKPMKLNICVIAGRHIAKPTIKGFINPFVEIEIFGTSFDNSPAQKYLTKTDKANGLNPYWNDKFSIEVLNPELALIRFVVLYNDTFGDPNFLGQATYPVQCLREGYRSIQLTNGYCTEEVLATILVHVRKE